MGTVNPAQDEVQLGKKSRAGGMDRVGLKGPGGGKRLKDQPRGATRLSRKVRKRHG